MLKGDDLLSSWMDTLALMLQLTREGKLRWERSPSPAEPDVYTAPAQTRHCKIEMLHPALEEDAPKICLATRVTFDGASMAFVSGTRGIEIVREALALCIPDWAERLEAEREAIESDRLFLHSLIEQ